MVNRKAEHNYSFIQTWVAGIQLTGAEVKAIRESAASFADSYCFFVEHELFLRGFHINVEDPLRDRKLLLTKQELAKLKKELHDGLTIVAHRVFLNEKSLIKVEIALAKGKKLYDKRASIKEKDIQRQLSKEKL